MNMMGESGVVSIKVRLTLILIETFAQESMLTNFPQMDFAPFKSQLDRVNSANLLFAKEQKSTEEARSSRW